MNKNRILNLISIVLLSMVLFGNSARIVVVIIIPILLIIQLLSLFKKDNKQSYFNDSDNIYELIHDIKTPAAANSNIIKLLIKGYFGQVNNEQTDILYQMQNSNKYMLNIINNISLLCSMEQNNFSLNYEKFDINQAILMCVENLKYEAMDKRCTLSFQHSEDNIYVFASKNEITRVIYNLLINAVKYSKSDRIITIITKIKDNKCQFEVNSFGNYLDKNDIKVIFEKYQSLGKTGNGLGLYISNQILKKHNCKMYVLSDLKKGNTFGFELKLCTDKQKEIINSK